MTERRVDASQTALADVSPDALAAAARALGPWFHNVHLPGGVQTAPEHPYGDFPRFKWDPLSAHVPQDLHGWRVLDVGCNGGFYSIELARRGAQVTAIDHDPRYLRQAAWAAQACGVDARITFRLMSLYALARLPEQYDLVWFMGVLYHLRHPLLALDILRTRARRLLMLQTLSLPEDDPAGGGGSDRSGIDGEHHGAPHRAGVTGVEPGEAHQCVATSAIPRDVPLMGRERLLAGGWPMMAFVEHRLAGDPTNWWVPSHSATEAMLRSSGFRILGRVGHETWLCTPDEDADADTRRRVADELDAVTGGGPADAVARA